MSISKLSDIHMMFNTFFKPVMAAGICAILLMGCDSSTSPNEEDNNDSRTFDVVLASDSSTIGTITTSRITEESDAYIDEGFFVTLEITDSDFAGPYDLGISDSGYCGTWNVNSGEKAEMPCDYNTYLADPSILIITALNGDGDEAHPVE